MSINDDTQLNTGAEKENYIEQEHNTQSQDDIGYENENYNPDIVVKKWNRKCQHLI